MHSNLVILLTIFLNPLQHLFIFRCFEMMNHFFIFFLIVKGFFDFLQIRFNHCSLQHSDQFQNTTINNSFDHESIDYLFLHDVQSSFVNTDMTESFDFFMIINSIAFIALSLFCLCDHHYDDNIINYFLYLFEMTT